MKNYYYLLIALFLLSNFNAFGQLTGTKTIPGDYATIAAAIADLNAQGVGTGGVTFNVAAGYTETFTSPTAGLITATGTFGNGVIFQKSGVGADPLITAYSPGSSTSTDYIICLAGADYFTFDGIDIQENPANNTPTKQMEWGYALVKRSSTTPFNGCQSIIIKNCSITLSKSNTNSHGIHVANHTSTSTSALTITAASDANNSCKFFNNTISNVAMGIYLVGFNASSPFSLLDQNNTIGVDGANTISNFGGGNSGYGIYAGNQNNCKIANNNINGGTGSTYTYGIYSSYNATTDIYNNTISLAANQEIEMIENLFTRTGTTKIYGNILENVTQVQSTTNDRFYAIDSYNSGNLSASVYNNTIRNINITLKSSTSLIAHSTGGSGSANDIYGNTFSNLTFSGKGNVTLVNLTTTSSYSVYNNTFSNITSSASGDIWGIYSYYGMSLTPGMSYYGNTFSNFSASGGNVYGIYSNQYSGNINIYKNVFNSLSASLSTSVVYAVNINSATGDKTYPLIYDNFISELKAPNSTNAIAVVPIYAGTDAGLKLYYNTIYVDGTSSGSGFGTSCIYFNGSSSSSLEMIDNILINKSVTTGSGKSCIINSDKGLYTYTTTSNNNCYYLSTGANHIFNFNNFYNDVDLDHFKARYAPNTEFNSFSEDAPFVNTSSTPYDLHINPAVTTKLESGGVTVSSVTTDYDGDTRNATTPDVGADEGTFTPNSAMTYVSSTTTQVLGNGYVGVANQAIIRMEVTVTGTTSPINVTSFTVSAAGTTNIGDINGSAAKIYFTGTSSQFSTGTLFGSATPTIANFTITGNKTLQEGTNYFWLAYTVSASASVGYPIDGTCSSITVASVPRTPTVTSPAGSKTILAPMAGSYTVGVGKNFTTITQAVNEVCNRGISGNVYLLLYDALYSSNETFPISITPITGSGSGAIVTIRPTTGVNSKISGFSSTTIFDITADYITIDGSNSGGTSRNLTIENTCNYSTNYTSVIRIANKVGGSLGADYNTIKNCIIQENNNTYGTHYGIYSYYCNNNLTLQNNQILLTTEGIYNLGDPTYPSANWVIQNNVIGSYDNSYIVCQPINLSYVSSAVIQSNTILNAVSTISTAGVMLYQAVNCKVTANRISYVSASSGGASGIWMYGTSTGNEISNNEITDVTVSNSYAMIDYSASGIYIASGTGYKIYNNSVYLTGTLNDSYNYTTAALLINSASSTGNDVRNNSFVNNLWGSPGTMCYAIYVKTGSTFTTINYNNYYGYSPNIILGYFGSDYGTLADWQGATGQDASSKNVNPNYSSSVFLEPSSTSALLMAGTPISGLTTDIQGITRSLTTPSIGAYEIGTDPKPDIVYTTLPNTYSASSFSLTGVTITDADGIASGSYAPRIYWKKNFSGTWTSSAATNGSSPYNFTITGSFSTGDTVFYFVIAQDAIGTVASMPDYGLAASNVNTVTTYPSTYSFVITANNNYGGGGAGTGGYYFANSTSASASSPSKPIYSWIDPVANGHTLITTWSSNDNDDGYFQIPDIGFDFNFFGNTYRTNNVFVNLNGFVSFGAGSTLIPSNYTAPCVDAPNNLIAGCLMDLTTAGHSDAKVYYGSYNGSFVITYRHLYSYVYYITFQVILNPDNSFKIQYNDTASYSPMAGTNMDSQGDIAIENSDGTLGISYRHDGTGGPMFGSPLAVQFATSNTLLPVELSSFVSKSSDRNIMLNWSTKTEVNFSRFEIERSVINKNNWTPAGSVQGQGNSNTGKVYTFTDKNLNTGKYNYRLKIIDNDGSSFYSNVINAEIGVPTRFALEQNYPNPFNPETKLEYEVPEKSNVTLEVFSVTGERVKQLVNELQAPGYYSLNFKDSGLASGIYFYRLIARGISGKIMSDTKKMILLK